MTKITDVKVTLNGADCKEGMGEEQRSFTVYASVGVDCELNEVLAPPIDNDDFCSLDTNEFKSIEEKIESKEFAQYIKDFFKKA